MRNIVHSEVVLTKNLRNINPPYWLSRLFEDVNVRDKFVIRLLICISQYEIRVIEFDLIGLIIQLYGRIFGYMERLELVSTLVSMFLILDLKRFTRLSHLMFQNLLLENRCRTLVLSLDFVDS